MAVQRGSPSAARRGGPRPAALTRFWRGPAVGVAVVTLLAACGTKLWEPSRAEVLQRILPSAVQIVLEQHEGRRFRTGSGVAIASRPGAQGIDCFVLTSGHTLSTAVGTKEVYVLFGRHQGAGAKVRATVLAHRDTSDTDLALLKAHTDLCVPARPALRPTLGESIWVVAFPWGRHITLASGVVSQVGLDGSDDRDTSRLMVDASVSYGSSGAGVYEERTGRLIGIVEGYRTARVTPQGSAVPQGSAIPWYIEVPVPGQTFVTSIADIRRFLAEAGFAALLSERLQTKGGEPG